MTTAKKNFKILFYRGNMTNGGYSKGYYDICNIQVVNYSILNLFNFSIMLAEIIKIKLDLKSKFTFFTYISTI